VSWGDKDAPAGPVTYEGQTFDVKYEIVDGGVQAVHLRANQLFPSMQTCAMAWRALRSQLDQRFGPSDDDNLAAYWRTTTSQIAAECDPIDPGTLLQIDFLPVQPME
jgi:hypothetical protein